MIVPAWGLRSAGKRYGVTSTALEKRGVSWGCLGLVMVHGFHRKSAERGLDAPDLEENLNGHLDIMDLDIRVQGMVSQLLGCFPTKRGEI